MMWYVYRLSDGRFMRGLASLKPDYDPATEAVQEYTHQNRPDTRLHRYDATVSDKKRLATAQELADFDAERKDAEAVTRFDVNEAKMLKALAIWTAQKLGIPLATTRAEILTIYKGL
jgi:hypothetical protein